MKGIRKNLIAGILACSTFNAQAELSPFSYGIKAGGSSSWAYNFEDATLPLAQKAKSSILSNFAFMGSLYGEYAFTDYIGLALEAGYMKQGAKLAGSDTKKTDGITNSDQIQSVRMNSHGIYAPLQLCVYPMGREEGEGILKLHVGIAAFMPLGDPTLEKDDKAIEKSSLTANQKKEYPTWDASGLLGLEYEFPFGLSIEGRWGIGLRNRFSKSEAAKDQTLFDSAYIANLKNMKLQYASLNVGYNIASLFTDSESA